MINLNYEGSSARLNNYVMERVREGKISFDELEDDEKEVMIAHILNNTDDSDACEFFSDFSGSFRDAISNYLTSYDEDRKENFINVFVSCATKFYQAKADRLLIDEYEYPTPYYAETYDEDEEWWDNLKKNQNTNSHLDQAA